MNIQMWLRDTRRAVGQWLLASNEAYRYLDSTQIGVAAVGEFKPGQFTGGGSLVAAIRKGAEYKTLDYESKVEADAGLAKYLDEGWALEGLNVPQIATLPQVSGITRVYKGFRPQRCIVSEMVTATFSGKGLPDLVRHERVEDASDLVLVQCFAGAENCFPNAPTEANGICGAVFAASSGIGISWPPFESGTDVAVAFAIEPTILTRASGRCGGCGQGGRFEGYDVIPSSIKLKVRVNFLGPSLR